MPDATVAASPAAGFTRADLTTFCRLDELGLEVTGQRLEPGRFPVTGSDVDNAALEIRDDRSQFLEHTRMGRAFIGSVQLRPSACSIGPNQRSSSPSMQWA